MTDKNSAKTEDEILEQTFGSFDTQMTELLTESNQENKNKPNDNPSSNLAQEKKKGGFLGGMGQNKILMLVGGAAVVGVAGFMGLQMLSAPTVPPVVAQQPILEQPSQQIEQVTPDPTIAGITSPTAESAATENQGLVGTQIGNQILQPIDVPQDIAQQDPNTLMVNATQQAQQISDRNNIENLSASVTPGSSNQELEKIQNNFIQKHNVLTNTVENLSSRVNQLEEQNRQLRALIERINAQRAVAGHTEASRANRVTTARNEANRAPSPPESEIPAAQTDNAATVLVDNRSGERRTTARTEIQLPDIQVHSIHNGRIWIRNENGSMSTFVVGERLPTGETIRSISENNLSFSTNRRTINIK